MLEETRTQAKIRATFADKLRDQLTTPMKPYIGEKSRLFAKVRRERCPLPRPPLAMPAPCHARPLPCPPLVMGAQSISDSAVGTPRTVGRQYAEHAQRVQTDLHVGYAELARVREWWEAGQERSRVEGRK